MRKSKSGKAAVAVGIVAVGAAVVGAGHAAHASYKASATLQDVKFSQKVIRKSSQSKAPLLAEDSGGGFGNRGQKGAFSPSVPA